MERSVIIIIIAIILYLIISQNQGQTKEYFNEFNDLFLTNYNKNFTCSRDLDKLPKHVRLNNSGGVMYVSHQPPLDSYGGDSQGGSSYKQIECPPLMVDDITPMKRDHYNPHRLEDRIVRRNNMFCWQKCL